MTAPLELGFRLSPQQLRAWRLQKDGVTSCSILCALRIEGDLDRRALRRALGSTVARHEILRTAFRLPVGLSTPLQVILEPGPVSLPEVDLRDLALEHRWASATALLCDLDGPPFQLERGEGWRAALVRLGPCEHEMLFVLSAACADPGAFEPLAADLLAAYARQVAGGEYDPEPPLQYADVAEWQNSLLESEDAAEGIETWREHWRGHDIDARISLPLPLQESEVAPGPFAPREAAVPLARETAGALARLAEVWGCPLQVLILTALKAVIQRGTGRNETLVGVLYSGRDVEELQGVIGPLARYLPVVARFSTESSLREAVVHVQQGMKKAESWGEYFDWDHVDGNGHGTGGFPACFEAGRKDWEQAVDGLRVAPVQLAGNLDLFSLALSCRGTGEELRLALRFDPRRFRTEAAHHLAGRLSVLLGSVAARPEAPLTDHPAMAEEELSRWLELSVAPPTADRGREGRTLHAVFEEQADRTPDRLAVAASDGRLTFRDLDVRANRLAHHLQAAGAGPEVPVALCLERSAEAVVALLAVWKAGAAYVPLDPTQPAERLAYLLEDTGAPLLVTNSRLASALPGAGGLTAMRMVQLDEEATAIALRAADRPAGGAAPRNLAYVIYTSGSTGRPKGVQVEHRSALRLLAALEAAVLDPLAQSGLRSDPLLASLNAPMIFDASVQQLALLLAGHALCVVPQDIRADGAALLAFLREQEVDLLDCTPSQLRLLVDAGLLDGPEGPRLVLTAGEAVDEFLWKRLAQAERTVCFNLYGPTECSVDATFHRIEPGSARPTIGRPMAGYEAFLLDRSLQPVPPGAPGELCLGGAALARGYLRRPDLTAERFVPHAFARRPGERLYRSGDLGRHLPNGDLEFLGRLDHQVKIRGFRIELGEIEAVLAELAGVREAVVVAHASATGDRQLAAYVVGDVAVDRLRQGLRQRLPDYMVPAAFVSLPALPLNANGKVDRKALPAPEWQCAQESYLAPRTPVEEILAGIWAEVLGLERMGTADRFFDLGGHSLLAMQVISRLRSAFDIEMPLRALFENPTLADLAARVETAMQAGSSRIAPPLVPLVPTEKQRPLPLSFAQQRLWFIDRFEPGTPLYNIPITLRVEGPLDSRVLALCFGEIVRRHETLRTAFAESEGSPVQVIQPATPFGLNVVDLSGLPESCREALAATLAGEEAGRPFDLARGPLLRSVLLRLAKDDHVAALTMHHIVSDGWSMGILVREIAALYPAFAAGRPSPLPELPVQYADFAVWQRSWLHGEVLESEISFWRRQLAGLPPLLELPTDRPRPAVQSFRGATRPVRLPAEVIRQVEALGRREGATLFMVLLAGFQVLLARYSGQDDFAIGTPVAGRNRMETEGLIGFFVNTLVVRGDLLGDPPFRDLLGRVRETALAAYLHQDVPFEKLVGELAPQRSLAYTPLFQVMLVLQNVPAESLEIRNLRLRPMSGAGTMARFDLTLNLTEHGGGLGGTVDYAADLFDAATAERLEGHLLTLLEGLGADSDRRLSELPLLSDGERHQLLASWTGPRLESLWAEPVHNLFARAAERDPAAPALFFAGETVSYGALRRRASSLAAHLAALGVGPETRVALAVEPSPEMIVGLLGILEAGGAYVPVDPVAPPERLAFLLADAEALIVLTQERHRATFATCGAEVVCLDTTPPPSGSTALHLGGTAVPESAAYVIYTSGSTGAPKGVVAPHGGLASFTRAMAAALRLGPGDRVLQFASLSFDASAVQIFPALASGAALVLHPAPRSLSPSEILDLCVRTGVTVLDLPAALWRQWVAALPEETLGHATIRAYLTGGEAVPTTVLQDWAARVATGATFLSSYGPTEATVTTTAFQTAREGVAVLASAEVPLGRPLPNTRLALLDRHGQTPPQGTPGEIYIGGAGVTRGYLHRPDLTAERFVPDPISGQSGARLYRTGDLARLRSGTELEFLGRADQQVKVRGYRIELGEIEAALVALPGVREAAVLVHEDCFEGGHADRKLVAYVVGDAAVDPDSGGARLSLRERLPDYMVPAAFVMLSALPLTPSGKLDRKALPAPQWQSAGEGYLAPRTPVEEVLAGIWAELLGLEQVGTGDDFFDLGGHSLLATQVTSRLRGAFGVEMPLRDLFEASTLADLAARVDAALRDGAGLLAPPLIPTASTLPKGQPLPLSFAQQRLWFIDQLEPDSPLYNIPAALRVEGPLRAEVLALCLGEIVRRHEALRTVFIAMEGSPVQVIQPVEPFRLAVVDLSGLPEREREALALSLAGEEAVRPFDLRRGPLLRGMLLRLTDGDHVALLTMHHIVSDGWSMGILVREVTALYPALTEGRPSPLPELPVQYADFAAWQASWLHGETLEGEISFWSRQLAGLPPQLELPTDRPRPAAQSFRGASRPVRLPTELSRQAQALSRREGATLFMVLLAGFQILLARYSGQQDLAVGTPVAGRNRVETEDLIGFFVNTLVLRGNLTGGDAGEPSFRELLSRVRETALDAHTHQDVPFEKLVQELSPERSLAHTPLFQVVLALHNAPVGTLAIRNLRLRPVDPPATTAKFDLTLSLEEHGGGLIGTFEYATDLFDAATIDRLILQYERLLTAVLAEPEHRAGELPLLPAAERHQVLVEWNDTAVAREEESAASLIQEPFEAWARRTPDAVAAVWRGESLTYGALQDRAYRLAHHLACLGAGPGSLVGIHLRRGPGLIVAVLAVLEAGAAYVPLEIGHPPARLRWILDTLEISCLITETAQRDSLPELPHVICLDLPEPADLIAPKRPITMRRASPDDLAYIIFTSGSTGTPKGVMVRHRPVINLLRWAYRAFAFSPADRVLFVTSLSFDLSVFDIFGLLGAGGSIRIADEEEIRDPERLLRALAEEPITFWDSAPAALEQTVPFLAPILDGLDPQARPALRLVFLSGDWIPVTLPDRIRERFPGARVVALGGATEATVWSNVFPVERVEPSWTSIPYGRPIENARYHVLDTQLAPCPVGVPGDLYIGGDCLADGYAREPVLTAHKFLPDPWGATPGGRLYRTGDRARYRPDGNLEFLGRLDHQVKIRGFRIELGEIEAALSSLPGVREAVVVVRDDRSEGGPGDRRLVAYVAGDVSGIVAEELRRSLRERLPDYMVPPAFVTLAALPLTPNGKVDRKALPAPEYQHAAESWQVPRTPVEEVLAGIWAELLGHERVGAADDFFDLGGHSLLATQVISHVRGTLGIEMPLRDLFEAPVLADFAARGEAALRSGTGRLTPPLVRIEEALRDGALPLSFAQQRLWFIDQLEPGSPLYNLPVALRVEGPLHSGVLALCLGEIVRRHETLRTVFTAAEGSPVQVIQAADPFRLTVVDLSGLPAREREAPALTLTAEESARPFDLTRGPLLRGVLLRLAEGDHILVLTMHHIVSDGWSMGILVSEVTALYTAFAADRPSPLPELPVQYADFAVWQHSWLRGDVLGEEMSFWRRQLAGLPPLLALPTDRPRPAVQSYRGAERPVRLPAALTRQVAALARREGATLFMVLLAGFQTLLARYSGQSDLAVGSPVAGRNRMEIEDLIGFFLNMLVLRGELGGDLSFRDLLAQVRETALAAYLHQDLPFEKLVEELAPERSLAHFPLFQVMLMLQNAPTGNLQIPDLRLRPVSVAGTTAKFDLLLGLAERGGAVDGGLEYAVDLFDSATVDRLIGHFEQLLAAAVTRPGEPAFALPLVSEAERFQILVEWNHTGPVSESRSSVHELFETQVRRTPEAVAVVFGDEELTYAGLGARADRIARRLRRLGVGPDVLVGLLVERSLDMIAGVLGILQAGGVYVPLDPRYPAQRLAFMLEDTRSCVMLTQAHLRDRLPAEGVEILPLDGNGNIAAADGAVISGGEPSEENLAYVIYTSGSTGRPKGVALSHGALRNLIDWHLATLVRGVRTLQLASLSFDASFHEMFACWGSGGTLVVVPEEQRRDMTALAGLLVEQRIEKAILPVVVLAQLAEVFAGRQELPPLREITTTGERLQTNLAVAALLRRLPGCTFHNHYGPSETHVATAFTLSPDPEDWAVYPSIGRPIRNSLIYVVEPGLVPAPVGMPGELYLGGACLARGYLERPCLTAEKFVPNPFGCEPGGRLYRTGDKVRLLASGELEYLGRFDDQVKIRGFRIEPGEIEETLVSLTGVREAVVVAREDMPGSRRLVAYVVGDLAADELRQSLRERLPDYMVPAAFVTLAALPLTPNGKVDRKALPAPEWRSAEEGYLAPRTPVEEVLAGIWAELLGLERVGAADHFFDLGGHSLLGTQLRSLVREAWGVELPLRTLFERPTLSNLATAIEALRSADAAPKRTPIGRAE